jgi:DNA-binding IclR family transcriptional regulator
MRKAAKGPVDQKRRVQSIEVGFRVIRVLQAAREPMALRDIAKAAQMPPSKAHLYLASFLLEDLVSQDAKTGRYGLGEFAIELGLSAISQLSIVDLAKSDMAELTSSSGCPTYLSLFTARGPTILAKTDGSRQGAFSVRLGYVLPMTGSATGLIFLAYLPEAETLGALELDAADDGKQVGGGAIERAAMARRLTTIREKGYATTTGLINANFAAISVPIFDYNDGLAAALTLLGPDKYLVGARLQRSIEDVRKAGARISTKLGGKANLKNIA